MRDIVENYYSSTFVPNPTTGHIALVGQQEEEGVEARRKRKRVRKGKGGDNYKSKGKGKNKGKGGYNNKLKGKGAGYSKGGKEYHHSSSWNSSSWNYNKGKGRGKGKGKPTTTSNSVQCHTGQKFGHVAANCWRKNTTTYTIAAIGSGTPSQPQGFDLNNTTLDRPVACMPRDQLPTQ